MAIRSNRFRKAGVRQLATIVSISAAAAVAMVPAAGAATQAPLRITNTALSASVGASVKLTVAGGTGSGAVTFVATGIGCAVNAKTAILTDVDAGTCSVVATKAASGAYTKVSSAPVVFTFVGKPQAALKISTTPTTVVAGSSVKLATTGGTGTGVVTFTVTGSGCNYSTKTLVLTAAAPTTCSTVATKAGSGAYAAATSPAVTFTFVPKTFAITNTTLSGPVGTPITVTAKGGTATGTVNYGVTGTGCTIGLTSGVLNATQATSCAVTAIVISGGKTVATSAPVTFTFTFVDNPTVANPDVATLTSVTGATGNQIDDTVDGDNYFIKQYYNAGDHWYGYYIKNGAAVTLTWHVTGSNGQALANAPVSLLSNLAYSCAKNLTWSTASLNVYAGCGNGAQGTLSGTTDPSGNVSFTLTNTNNDTGSAPADTTTTAGMESNEGPFSWTDMVLQVGSDTYTGDPTSTVNQGTDRVDFIVIPTPSTTPQTSANYQNPDVATMTSVTGIENAAPLDDTTNGDNWFIDAYYSPGDHWNFSYVPEGGSITETWHVKSWKGTPLANATVTLMTAFAPGNSHWTATGIDGSGNVAGTTDVNGNVTFTVKNTDTGVTTVPADLTKPDTALALEQGSPWTRMALVIGTPVADNSGNGLQGSSTDTITAASSAIKMVNQATDLVDFIVTK